MIARGSTALSDLTNFHFQMMTWTPTHRNILLFCMIIFIVGGYHLHDRSYFTLAPRKQKSAISTPCFHTLEGVLASRAIDHQIVVTMMNYAYIDLVFHWIFRLQRMGVNNFFVYVLDQNTADSFQEHHLGHLCYFNNMTRIKDVSSHASPGSERFKAIGNDKMFLADKILHLNYSVLMSEIDVAWIRDPRPHLMNLSKQYDTISQGLFYTDADNRRNIGFFYLSARPIVLDIMDEVVTILTDKPTLWDQAVFNQVVDRALHQKRIRDIILDRFTYMFEPFFMNYSLPSANVTVAHLVGLDLAAGKTFVIKERLFSEDPFGYLSGTRNYLTYENRWIDPPTQVRLLKKALYLAKVLNRTLILPRFHCHHIGYLNHFHQMTLSPDCTAERFVDIQYLHEHYQIRESSFLNNPLLPARIRDDRFRYNGSFHDLRGLDDHSATILHIVNIDSSDNLEQNNHLKTCPPSNTHPVVLGYGPICR